MGLQDHKETLLRQVDEDGVVIDSVRECGGRLGLLVNFRGCLAAV